MRNIVNQFEAAEIAVVGDLMLDCYLQGHVERISPEAPVPVVRAQSEHRLPGGAANVATNLLSLRAKVQLVGVTGSDEAGESLVGLLLQHGLLRTDGIIADAGRPTTRKLRVVGSRQQITRIDFEDASDLSEAVEERIIAAARSAVAGSRATILSDYGKGLLCDRVVQAAVEAARVAGAHLLVDPKRRDWSIYRGATLITPNRRELFEATGLPCETDAEAAAAAARAREICGADILLTRSEKGMSFFPVHGDPLHLPTVAREVFDVSGAGDTVIAVLAASLAIGMPMPEAMKLANHAAGIVVGKLGTATVSPDELTAAMADPLETNPVPDGHLVSLEEAVAMRQGWSRAGLTVGIANGCFDLLHPGHIALIRQAAAACDRLIMALNSDASTRRLKGMSRPVQSEIARADVIGAIKGVAAVVLFDEDTPLRLIEALLPDVLVKGADYTEENVVGADIVKAHGGRLLLASLSPGQSTTRLVASMAGK